MRILPVIFTALVALALGACKQDDNRPLTQGGEQQSGNTTAPATTPQTGTENGVSADTLLLPATQFDNLTNADRNIAIIDLRPEAEYKKGHIWRAANIDASAPDFMNKMAALSKTNKYALYDQFGQLSIDTAEKLRAQGFQHVYVLKNGLSFWGDTGKPLQIK